MASVFISHRMDDRDEARQLASEIRIRGHSVWFDEWNIGLGDSIVERINTGLASAAYVIVCYSGAGMQSPWMSREWMSGLARQLEGAGVKLLPVRLKGGEPPPILADIAYADLSKDWKRGVDQLCNAIR
jgi:TIR domain